MNLRLIRCTGCWFLLVLLAFSGRELAAAHTNIVLIFADDLGYGDLECFGHPSFKTPHLNRMAAEGLKLTRLYVPTPYCAPSRGTLLTGRYPFRHGVWKNPAPDGGINDVGLAAEELTLAEILGDAGYATACIGKWHLGHLPKFMPRTQGFQEYLGILYSNDMRPVNLIRDEQIIEYPVVQATLTRRYTEAACDFIHRNRHRPFFLYLPHTMPHKPLAASEEFYGKSGAGLYGDVLAELDWGIGQVFERLRKLNLDQQTIVVFASDNGPWYGGSTGGLRGMKSTSWEGGYRVPGIIRWPGRIAGGGEMAAPCGTIDVLPTLLAAAGLEAPQDHVIDGINLLPVMEGKQSADENRTLLGMRGNKICTVRTGRYRLHLQAPNPSEIPPNAEQWIDPRRPDGVTLLAPYEQYKPVDYPGETRGDSPKPMMLFDIESDPAEVTDISGAHPEVIARIKAAYEAAVRDVDPSFLVEDGARK